MAEKILKNKKASGIEIHGHDIRVDGIHIPGVRAVSFSQDSESIPRTVIELDGDFDYTGLSGVEFVLHPISLREALRCLSLWSKFHPGFSEQIGAIARESVLAAGDDAVTGKKILQRFLEELE